MKVEVDDLTLDWSQIEGTMTCEVSVSRGGEFLRIIRYPLEAAVDGVRIAVPLAYAAKKNLADVLEKVEAEKSE